MRVIGFYHSGNEYALREIHHTFSSEQYSVLYHTYSVTLPLMAAYLPSLPPITADCPLVPII